MRIKTEQRSFSRGEVDPGFEARSDVEMYYASLSSAKNTLSMRQGGIYSRPGFRFLDSLPIGKHKIFEFIVDENIKYIVVFSAGQFDVYRDGIKKDTVTSALLTNDIIEELNFTQLYDTMILFHPSLKTQKIFRVTDTNWTMSDVVWNSVPTYNFVPSETDYTNVTLTPSAKSDSITLEKTSGTFSFTANDVNQVIIGNGGKIRITEYVSATKVKGYCEVALYDSDSFSNWTFYKGYEDAWSETRGYPVSGCFYEGRLWIGGSQGLPSRVWGSKVNLFFDFALGALRDDDGIDYPSNDPNPIVNLRGGRSLQVFTTGSELVVAQSLLEPITPKNMNLKEQTSIGSKYGLRVFDIEGSTFFINKQSLHNFTFSSDSDAYNSSIVSLLSGHLIKNPVDFCVRKTYNEQGATYACIVNDNGRMTVVNILLSQDVMSFSDLYINGKILNCGTDIDNIYIISERTINGNVVNYLEVLDYTTKTDCCKIINTTSRNISGLSHLEGEEVYVVIDDYNQGFFTVTNGEITLPRAPVNYVEVGYNYISEIEDMPTNTPQQSTLGTKKNVSEVVLDLFETSVISLNGKSLSFREFGGANFGSPLDNPLPYFTGIKIIKGLRGWDYTGKIKITKDVPGIFKILSISKRVNV
jgi:hypothetical protein